MATTSDDDDDGGAYHVHSCDSSYTHLVYIHQWWLYAMVVICIHT